VLLSISIFYLQVSHAKVDYSNVASEFERLFAGLAETTGACSSKIFEEQALIRPLLNCLTSKKIAGESSQRGPLSLQSCIDLSLLCGDRQHKTAALIQKLEPTQTAIGVIFLAAMMTKPITEKNRLERRSNLIELFAKEEELLRELENIIEEFKGPLESLVRILTSNSKTDSTCLLNKFFGFYWHDKSSMDFLPKKIEKKIKELRQNKDKDIKTKNLWGQAIDRIDTFLNISFTCTSFLVAMSWFSQIGSWGKNFGETFNLEFAKKLKNLLRRTSVSEKIFYESEQVFSPELMQKIKARSCLSDVEKIEAHAYLSSLQGLVDAAATEDPKFEATPNGLYKWFFTPRWRQQIRQEIVLLKEGLGLSSTTHDENGPKNFDPRVIFMDAPKLINRFLKPSYLFLAPPFLVSNIFREYFLYKEAFQRAKKELDDLGLAIRLCSKLTECIAKFTQQKPHTEEVFWELDLLGNIKELLTQNHNADFSKLVQTLRQGIGKNPGKFLRVYKQLYEMATHFLNVAEAFGQVDAFLTVAKISKNSGFCFAKFNEPCSSMVLEIADFWDPKMGRDVCVPNSISLNKQNRGMIITGSNAGGKSSFMRSVMSCAIMAQTICLVPATAARLCPFTDFFSLISKKDDPGAGRSLFRVEAEEVAGFLRKVDNLPPNGSLFAAIDEMFSSTGPTDACALTRAVVEYVAKSTQTFAMIASHCPGVYALEVDTANTFKNYKVSIERDASGNFVSYKRKIVPGYAKDLDSTALEVALMAGIPAGITQKAAHIKTLNPAQGS
jgi:DNA mismatch repair ATPase MutS